MSFWLPGKACALRLAFAPGFPKIGESDSPKLGNFGIDFSGGGCRLESVSTRATVKQNNIQIRRCIYVQKIWRHAANCVVLLVAMSMVWAGEAKASTINVGASNDTYGEYPQVSAVATLVNDMTGVNFDLPIAARYEENGRDGYQIEYLVDIPTAILAGDTEVTVSKYDPTKSARISILQNFSQQYRHGTEYVAVFYHKGRCQIFSPSVRCTELQITSKCNGEFLGGGYCRRAETRMWRNPANGFWYRQRPSWAGKYVTVNELGYYQGGIARAKLKRGNTTWTFEVRILNQGQYGRKP